MSRIRSLLVTFVLAAALCLAAAPAVAEDGAEAAARAAQAKHGGRVLAVKEKKDAYRVKILQVSGKVKIVEVPRSSQRDSGDKKRKQKRSERDD